MKKCFAFALLFCAALTAGCAEKTASEKLQEDMKKAGDQMNKEVKAWQ